MAKTMLRKPKGFLDIYKHKPGAEKDRTHYCPGCGHGVLHKLIAEALEDLDLIDDTILISPVGCSVFAYYYFNTGNFQVAHGRAPAVATAVSRANPDKVVISYQGDGDLAAIGGNNILQAANRGENIAVFFVNNAIYGMTGGQMAPTTLEGQITTTTPYGRDLNADGYPMKMSEVLSALEAPNYIERVSLHDAVHIRKARNAVRKALKNAKERKGFQFVEVLSACPSGWKIDPVKAMKWMEEKMLPMFPLGVYKDLGEDARVTTRPVPEMDPTTVWEKLGISAEKDVDLPRGDVAEHYKKMSIRVAGFGGQGIMVTGQTLASVALEYGYNVSWLPSYGPEMRGGTANCSVNIQDGIIGAAEAVKPNMVLAMNRPSLEKFELDLETGGTLIYNSTLIDIEPTRSDITTFAVPITGIADDLGNTRVQSLVNVGAYAAITGMFKVEDVISLLPKLFKGKSESIIDLNAKAVKAGFEYVKENF
ncbi:MAG: 2-ketoisovalerate ferredoxin oxidoreductase [Gemmatimonadaceae bacterium 4484_173]|nr:MAG: 2-ketoisovalerate ferredoxin oxidoreductase [Gemmatimonadaceae bacterium 4484_173]RKZ01225.1 MAG: 2-ketoisovalerate ferredoxin oxidoreductase [Candidatus Fermentibacteria bacterium]